MAYTILPSNRFLLTQEYRYPKPHIKIAAVFNYQDIKHFVTGNLTPTGNMVQSLCYVYLDRMILTSRQAYVGETKRTVATRHNATHIKSFWLSQIQLPLILVAESLDLIWDTETRRAIEAKVAWKLDQRNFDLGNAENSTWSDGGETDMLDDSSLQYVEDVSDLIVETALAMLCLPRDHVFNEKVKDSLNNSAHAIPITTKLENAVAVNGRIISNKLFEPSVESRLVIAKQNGVTVHGRQTADGKVIVTEINNLREHLTETAKSDRYKSIPAGQKKLLQESLLNSAGFYDWTGETTPLPPTALLSQAFGGPSPNIWREEAEEHQSN